MITSGGFGPTVGGPVAMGYVATEFSQIRNCCLRRIARQTHAHDSQPNAVHACQFQTLIKNTNRENTK